MQKSFIDDKALYREAYIATTGNEVYPMYTETIITKEEFLMCYEAWVLKAKEEGEKDAE